MGNNRKFKSWMKLDNAAIIYPSTLSKSFAAMFRLTITLKEKVDVPVLNKALKNIMNRFPTFNYQLKEGLFWCYFKYNNNIPVVQNDFNNPMVRMNFKKNNDFMFRVRTFDKRVSCEYFHALTDGSGGIIFLFTLVGEYLKLKNKINIKYNDLVLNPKDIAVEDEISDGFEKYSRKIGGLEHEEPAYHYKGTLEDKNILNIITGKVPIADIKRKCREYDCTITELLVSLMLESIMEIQEKENPRKKKPIKISVPVNLRNYYETKTLRNFSSYVNIKIDTKYGHYTFDEILKNVKHSIRLMLDEKKINAKITGNVLLANRFIIRIIPMFIKKYILSIGEFLMGDRYCTSTLSNIHILNIPNEIEEYIKSVGFIIGRSRGKPGSCGCINFKDNLYISFSRRIKETEYERLFFTKLIEMKIPVEVESNRGDE